jgi:biopolymer transport protein ExbD
MDLIEDAPPGSLEPIAPEAVVAPVVWGPGEVVAGDAPHIARPGEAAVATRPSRAWLRSKTVLQEAEMDMTPMVDVTFLLLIFFMVTASFAMQKSLNIPKPESDEPSTQAQSVQDFQENPDYVVVRVDALNTYHVSTAAWPDEIEAPSEQELLVKLRQARQGDSQGRVPSKLLVIANGEALHERVVTAIDAGNDVGLEEVQLLTVEDDGL